MRRSVPRPSASRLRAFPAILALAATLPCQGDKRIAPAKPDAPTVRVLALRGTPSERGETHGRALRKEIQALLARWEVALAERFGMPFEAFRKRFLERTEFVAAIDRHTPGLLDEVRGIAKGAAVPFESVFLLNLLDEVWAQGRDAVAKCTTVGLSRAGGQPALVAQNLDVPALFHGMPTVLHITEKGLQTYVVTFPGLIGANGLNDQRIAVGVNALQRLRAEPDGVPVAFVVRGVLRRKTWADARRFLYEVDHASGQCYTIGGPELAHAFECSAGRVIRSRSGGDESVVWHTNHPLESEDWAPWLLRRAADKGLLPREVLPPCPRFADLVRRRKDGPFTERSVVAALRSRDGGICNPSTFVCTVMRLSREPVLRVSPGNPADHAFQDFTFPELPKTPKQPAPRGDGKPVKTPKTGPEEKQVKDSAKKLLELIETRRKELERKKR